MVRSPTKRNNRPRHPSIWPVSEFSVDFPSVGTHVFSSVTHLQYIVHYIPCSGHRAISVETSVSTIPTSMNLGKRLLIVPTKSSIGEVESNFPLMTNSSLRRGHLVERSYNTSSALIHALAVSGPDKSASRMSCEKLNVTLSR